MRYSIMRYSMPRTRLLLISFTLLFAITGCSDNDARPNVPTPEVETPDVEERAADEHTIEEFVPDVAPPVAPALVRYHCAPGLVVEALYEGEMATLTIGNDEYQLAQEPAASGARYSDGQLQWHSKGDEAVLTGKDEMHVCLRINDEDPAASEMTQ